ncbi:FtsX-like permease family protein [Salinarimonas sp.]|uniref:ABC transporter permease n=1 Tax=Salinarimonas sp. TaxID=2766526 RepID=UPI0032D91C43
MSASVPAGSPLAPLPRLLRAELRAGIAGLRLFVACIALAAFVLGAVWMTASALTRALEANGAILLGGDVAVSVVNAPLDAALVARLAALGPMSGVAELRTTAQADAVRAPVEVKAVDDVYPLAGSVAIAGAASLHDALASRDGTPGAVLEPAALARLGVSPGDTIMLGGADFAVRGVLVREPDRLSAGRFLVGPRVLVGMEPAREAGLIGAQTLVDWRYRLVAPDGVSPEALAERVRALAPERGWELETPADAGDRIREVAARLATFLGLAAFVSLAIGLAGAFAGARAWIGRRTRTIALYRLSGAEPALVLALHAAIVALAAAIGIALGLALGAGVAATLMDLLAERLHLGWRGRDLLPAAALATLTLAIGLVGACAPSLAAAARTPPGAAMRSADAPPVPARRDALIGLVALALALLLAILATPRAELAAGAAIGLAFAAATIGAAGFGLARLARRLRPRSFVARIALGALAEPGAAATRAVALGIGIAGITAVIATQASLATALRGELPERIPDLVLLDVQPGQIEAVRGRIGSDPALGGVQASPFMRATITAVNGVPAEEALVRADKAWVIEGDRSFAWAAEPTGAELLAGAWWPADYEGPPLLSPEEDVQQAFDLVPGDRVTYSVLGRSFTSDVANIRKEYHRTFRPEFLLVASPEPFRNAPHSWIVSLEGETDAAVDGLVSDLARDAPGITAIDVRRIVEELARIVEGATLASLAVAGVLLVAGALTLAAIVAAEVDSRRRQAVAFTLIGASRGEIALARLGEAACVGLIAAVVGGGAGLSIAGWIVLDALRVDWAPGVGALLLPLALGTLAALAAGAAGGLGAAPRGRGQLVRLLAQ